MWCICAGTLKPPVLWCTIINNWLECRMYLCRFQSERDKVIISKMMTINWLSIGRFDWTARAAIICFLALFVAQTFRYVLNSEAFWTICNLCSYQLHHSQQGTNRTSMPSSFSRGDRHDECTLFGVGSVDFCWTHVPLLLPTSLPQTHEVCETTQVWR